MQHLKSLVLPIAFSVLVAASALAQQSPPPPKDSFKTVHLVTLTDADVPKLQAALDDVNKALATAGYSSVRYRLYKVVGKQAGNYNYMWEAAWPSGDAYELIHKGAEFNAAVKRHPAMDALMKDEVYNRYVEVTTTGR